MHIYTRYFILISPQTQDAKCTRVLGCYFRNYKICIIQKNDAGLWCHEVLPRMW
jgi:hypothetical protein